MNAIVKKKLIESYRKQVNERLTEKGIKATEMKVNRMVEAALVRRRFLEAANPATQNNTVGRGSFSFGNDPSNPADRSKGSGEVYDELFGLFVDAYATTVGYDILQTKQMSKSNITVNILEPVYAGGIITGTDSQNNLPEVFTVKTEETGSATALVIGTQYDITVANAGAVLMTVVYVGKDRSLGYDIFRVVSVDAGQTGNTLETILATAVAGIYTSVGNFHGFDETTVDYTQANVNHVQGYTAAGSTDTDVWTANGHDGSSVSRGNNRETGEKRDYRTVGMRKWNRNFSAETHKVKIAFTREMYQDMLMEEDTDLRSMSDVIGTEELSQSINQDVLSLVFAHGWQGHSQLHEINGFNANLHLANAAGAATTYSGVYGSQLTIAAAPAGLPTSINHNLSTMQRQIVSRIGYVGGVIGNRARMGKGDTVVSGTTIASAISDIRGFRESPFENDLVDNQDVAFLGTFKRMGLYEDTSMSVTDQRVSVSKKGSDKSSGLALCNYILADSVKTTAENTGEEVSMLYSRMVVAEKGTNPSLNYITMNVTGNAIV